MPTLKNTGGTQETGKPLVNYDDFAKSDGTCRYTPDEAAAFWQRMASAGGGKTPEFLSTHPSDTSRIRNLEKLSGKAKKFAEGFGVKF